jgi:hypothetical protein
LSNVVALAAGDFSCLALLSNGMVVGWGDSSSGVTNVPVGLTNVQAIAAGSSHCLALVGKGPATTSALAKSLGLSGSGFSVAVPSQSGRVYVLEYKNELDEGNWISLPLVAGDGRTVVLTDPSPGSAGRFYRVPRW